MERLPPPPAALLPPIADQQKRVSYERTSDSASYERTSDSYDQRTSPLSDQQRACLIRSLSDRLTDFQQEEKSRTGRTVPSPPLRLHHTHLRKQFEGGGKAQLAFGQHHHQQQGQGGAGQAYPQQSFPTGKPLHGPI